MGFFARRSLAGFFLEIFVAFARVLDYVVQDFGDRIGFSFLDVPVGFSGFDSLDFIVSFWICGWV